MCSLQPAAAGELCYSQGVLPNTAGSSPRGGCFGPLDRACPREVLLPHAAPHRHRLWLQRKRLHLPFKQEREELTLLRNREGLMKSRQLAFRPCWRASNRR